MRCSLLTGFLCFTRKCWGQHVGVKLVRGLGPCWAKCFSHHEPGQAACSVTAAALFVFGSQRRQPASTMLANGLLQLFFCCPVSRVPCCSSLVCSLLLGTC